MKRNALLAKPPHHVHQLQRTNVSGRGGVPRGVTMLTPNTPAKRFKYVLNTYGKKYPGRVLDTFLVLGDTVAGLEPHNLSWSRNWKAMRHTPKSAVWALDFRDEAQEWLDAIAEVESDRPNWSEEDAALGHPEFFQRSDADPLWPWLAKELVKYEKRYGHTRAKDAAQNLFGRGPALAQWFKMGNMEVVDPGDTTFEPGELVHRSMFEWVGTVEGRGARGRRRGIDLSQYDIQDLHDAVKSRAFDWWAVNSTAPESGEVVYGFDDGWTIQKLGSECLDAEGKIMQHCVGGYAPEVDDGQTVIYSLRDLRGMPHVTIEYVPAIHRFIQVMGKQNEEPKPEYQARVDEWAATWERPLLPPDELSRTEDAEAFQAGDEQARSYFAEWESGRGASIHNMPHAAGGMVLMALMSGATHVVDYHQLVTETFPDVPEDSWRDLYDKVYSAVEAGAVAAVDELKKELEERHDQAKTDAADEAVGLIEDGMAEDVWDVDLKSLIEQAYGDRQVPHTRSDAEVDVDEVRMMVENLVR